MRNTYALAFVLLLLAQNVLFAQSDPARPTPRVPEIDRVRLAEAFRLGATVGNRVWKDWDKAPFAVLLITPENEFLIRHPKPTPDFARAGYDPLLRSNIYFRKRTLNPGFLATFPVGGVPTVIIGQAENTAAKTSTPWVVTLFHEHFHQLQYSQRNYYKDVSALDLSRGDQTGMWMLNYAFPYADPEVKRQFNALSRLLAEALESKKEDLPERLSAYLEARRKLGALLKADDYKYFSFQVWQEGLARYTEYRAADAAADWYKPTKQFRSLKDYRTFKEVADKTLQGIFKELTTLQLDEYQRVAFYPLGAGEGLLLDKIKRRWQNRYFADRFYVDKYFDAPR